MDILALILILLFIFGLPHYLGQISFLDLAQQPLTYVYLTILALPGLVTNILKWHQKRCTIQWKKTQAERERQWRESVKMGDQEENQK